MNLYHLFDSLLVVALFSRLIAYYYNGGVFSKNLELNIYIVALFLNLVVHLFSFGSHFQFNFIHVVTPIGIAGSIILSRYFSSLAIVLLVAGLSASNLFFFNKHLIVFIYQLAILLLVLRGIKQAKSRSGLIRLASTYFVIAVDLLLTMSICIFSKYDIVWQPSILMTYWEVGSKLTFTLILVFIHVQFRRHYTA